MPIQITFEGVLPKHKYQAYIYESNTSGRRSYRVGIGREGTKCPPAKDLVRWHELSDFMHGPEIQIWVGSRLEG